MATTDSYLSYLAHKIAKLEREIEEIKKLLKQGYSGQDVAVPEAGSRKEAAVSPAQSIVISAPAGTVAQAGGGTVVSEGSAASSEDPVVKILREKGPMNIIDINAALKQLGINEDIRTTLFNRIKGLMERGVVEYDEATQTFRLKGK